MFTVLIVYSSNDMKTADSIPSTLTAEVTCYVMCKNSYALFPQRKEYANISKQYQSTMHFELTKFDCVLGLNYF